MSHTFVIAEMASCHDGRLDRAKQLVEVAVAAGADAVKAQFWSDADRLADRRRVPDEYREVYRRYRMPEAWLGELQGASDGRIEFLCTVFLPEDVVTVAPFVDRWKISSFEAKDRALLAAIEPHDKLAIVSLGMGATDILLSGSQRARFLHCVSAYPADEKQMNLRRVTETRGLSDHSRQIDMGALAVAAGAEIIEAHVRLDDTDPDNPDYAVSFTPAEFAEYVRLIRRAERIMGTGERTMQPCEAEMAQYRVTSP